ncbi:hypothetical protein J6590_051770 [Homalodisca vitripennis]|nr:hypothetical protein J6590_051770 [Homalodisca vitripennis]
MYSSGLTEEVCVSRLISRIFVGHPVHLGRTLQLNTNSHRITSCDKNKSARSSAWDETKTRRKI